MVNLFQKPAQSDVDQALLKWLKKKRSGMYVPVGVFFLLVITFVLPELNLI
jgi:hypothetical protein